MANLFPNDDANALVPNINIEFSDEEETDDDGDVVDEPKPSTYDVGGPSTAIAAQPQVIDDLYIQVDNLRDRQGVLTRKMEEVSDAEPTNSVAIGGIHPRVAALEDREGTLMQYMLWMEERLTVLEKRLPGPPPGAQIMPPKQMSQAAIAKLVSDEVAKALAADRATRNATGAGGPGNVEGACNAGGPERAQQAKDCSLEDTTGPSSRIYTLWEANTRKERFLAKDAVKEDSALNKKVLEAIEAYTKNSSSLTELFSLHGQNHLLPWPRILVPDCHPLNSLRLTSSLICSVPATLTITAAPTSVEGENATNTANEALLLTLRGSIPLMRINPEVEMMTCPSIIQLTDTTLVFPNSHDDAKIELIGSSSNIQLVDTTLVIPSLRSYVALTILTVPGIHVTKTTPPEPQVPQREGKGIATDETNLNPNKAMPMPHIVSHLNKEKKLKKAKEALMTKIALIKVFHEKAKKIGLDPKTIKSAKGGEQFKKVHIPFKFTNFRVNELDELGPIIQKKKNRTVKALMLSLGKRYERLKNIPEELGIQSALPAPAPEQALS
ncbi:hypothetical protein Tco_1278056 [Tanacetum coccineum]